MREVLPTLASEWGKTWSVRAPWGCLLATAALVALTALSLANDFVVSTGSGEQPPDATLAVLEAVGPALQFGQLAFAAFALQLITSEYSSGTIRTTLRGQPRRCVVLAAKTVVAAICGGGLGAVLGAASAWGGDAVLGAHAAPGGPPLVEVAARSGALLALVGVLVVGLGTVLRSAVGTLAASAVLLLGTLALPSGVGRWAPGQAGAALLDPAATAGSSVTALVVLVAWAAGCWVAGAWLLERRDA